LLIFLGAFHTLGALMSTPRSAADFVDTFRESGDLPPRVAKVVEDIIADYGIDTHAIVTRYLEEVLVAGTEIHSRRIARHVRRRLVRLLEQSHESPAFE
jgi:hypothetical protein